MADQSTAAGVPFPIADGLVPVPLDKSILEIAEQAGLNDILNTPVADVLSKAGLPPLPMLPPLPPLPGMPPLPPLDLANLFKPLTDLMGSFGSGELGAGGFDPTTLFSTLSSVMSSSVSLSSGALKALDGVWKGSAATASAAKTTTAAAEGTTTAAKATSIVVNTQGGAATVAVGNASMQAVLAKFSATVTAALPLIMTPVGQTAVIAAAIIALSEGTAIVTGTKTALTPQTAAQQANAVQTGITGAPNSTSPLSIASTVLDGVGSPLTGMASTGMNSIGSLTKQITTPNKVGAKATKLTAAQLAAQKAAAAAKKAGAGGGGKGGGVGGGGKGGSGGGIPPVPLQDRPGLSSVGGATSDTATTNAGARTVSATTAQGTGMMPMGGAGAAGAAGAAASRGAGAGNGYDAPDFLVTAEHGNAVVGEMVDVTPAVIGEQAEQASAAVESPDVSLRL